MLKKGREHSGLTTRDAGERAGVSFAYLNQMENGHVSRPSPSTLFKLSRLYGLPFDLIMEKAGHVTDDSAAAPGEIAENLSILIIDECDEDRDAYIKFLSRPPFKNCMFVHAKNGESGISLCGKTAADCVILNYRLPDMEGVEVLKALKREEATRHVPVLFIIGQGGEMSAIQAILNGASSYIVKERMEGEFLARAVISSVKSMILHRYAGNAVKLRECNGGERLAGKIAEIENLALLLESTTKTPSWEKLAGVDRAVCGGVKQLAMEISGKIREIGMMINPRKEE